MNVVSRDPLPFNPAVLRWARARAGMEVEEVAERIATTVERVAAWEAADTRRQPTIKQARRLANLYGRPLLEFFARTIPDVPRTELVPDYRFHRVPPSGAEARVLEAVQRWAEEQRFNLLDLYDMLGETPPAFPAQLYATVDSDVDVAAARAREATGFSLERQWSLNSSEKRQLPDILRRSFEACGVLGARPSNALDGGCGGDSLGSWPRCFALGCRSGLAVAALGA